MECTGYFEAFTTTEGVHQTSTVPLSTSAPINTTAPANTSGQGKASVVPVEIKKWNWGAFLLNLIWGLFNGVYIVLLIVVIDLVSFINIPLLRIASFVCNLAFVFILGAKGSEWAWRHKHWDSVEHFIKVQRKWTRWAFGILISLCAVAVIGIVLSIVLVALNSARQKAMTAAQNAQSSQSEVVNNPNETTSTSSPTSITKQVNGITFVYPSNWTSVSPTNQNTLFTLEFLQDAQVLARVGLLQAPLGNSTFAQGVQQVASALATGGTMGQITSLEFGGKTAEEVSINTTESGQQVTLSCIFVDGGNGEIYLLEYAATVQQFSTFKPQAEQIMNSVQFPS